MTVRAAVLEAPHKFEIRSFPIPDINAREGLIEVELVGVCGTDYKFFDAKTPAPLPMILGHEILGRIAEIGPEAARSYGVQVGDRVSVEATVPCWSCPECRTGQLRFCKNQRAYGTRTSSNEPPGLWGAMSEMMYIAPGSILHKTAPDLPSTTAMSAGLVANGIEWLLDAGGLRLGDAVVIQGAGPQGLAAVAVARACGAGNIIVTGLARDAARLQLAMELGANTTLVADDAADLREAVAERTQGQMADVVLDVTGAPSAVRTSVHLVRAQGTLVLAGLTGAGVETGLELDLLAWKAIRVQGVFSKSTSSMTAGVKFVAANAEELPLERLVSHVYSLDEVESAVRSVAENKDENFIKAAISPNGS